MWLGQWEASQSNVIRFIFATEHRFLRGCLHTTYGRLVDALNADRDQMLQVVDTAPCDAEGTVYRPPSPCAGVAIANLLYCVPLEDALTPPRERDSYTRVKRSVEWVELGMGPFVLRGYLHLPEGSPLCDALGMVRHRFVVLTEAQVSRIGSATPPQAYPVVVVNGPRVEYMMKPDETESQPTCSGDALTVAG